MHNHIWETLDILEPENKDLWGLNYSNYVWKDYVPKTTNCDHIPFLCVASENLEQKIQRGV